MQVFADELRLENGRTECSSFFAVHLFDFGPRLMHLFLLSLQHAYVAHVSWVDPPCLSVRSMSVFRKQGVRPCASKQLLSGKPRMDP